MLKDKLNPTTITYFLVLHEHVVPKLKEAEKNGDGQAFGQLGEKYGLLAHELYLAMDGMDEQICLPPYLSINRYRASTDEQSCLPEDVEFWAQGDAILLLHKFLLDKGVFDDVCT